MVTWTPIRMTAEDRESYDIEGYGMTDFDDDLWYQVVSSMPVVVPTLEIEVLAGESAFFEAVDATVAGAAPAAG